MGRGGFLRTHIGALPSMVGRRARLELLSFALDPVPSMYLCYGSSHRDHTKVTVAMAAQVETGLIQGLP